MRFVVYMTCVLVMFFFFKQKTAYEMRISDWSSDVCSSDLLARRACRDNGAHRGRARRVGGSHSRVRRQRDDRPAGPDRRRQHRPAGERDGGTLATARHARAQRRDARHAHPRRGDRSEEHTSELQSLMRISYAVFCLKKKKKRNVTNSTRAGKK